MLSANTIPHILPISPTTVWARLQDRSICAPAVNFASVFGWLRPGVNADSTRSLKARLTAPGTCGSLILCAVCGVAMTVTLPAQHESVQLQKFLASPALSHSYSGTRRLEAAGSGQRGWLDARTEFTPDGGLNYEVTAEGGSDYIRRRVLRTLLEEERRLIARGDSSHVGISPANYTFTDEGMSETGLVRVGLQPRRSERALVIGRMFLNPRDGELVRVEGRLAKSPSFWVSRVSIVRLYERINGALMPVLLESTAQLRLLGRSTLRMTYSYSQIDRRKIPGEKGSDTDKVSRD